MLDNYQSLYNYKEITRMIAHKDNHKGCFLWQNTSGKRYVFEIEDLSVNERMFSFSAIVNRKMFPFFSQLSQTFCKLQFRQAVFKVSIISIDDNKVVFKIPNEVKSLELREYPRQKFRPSQGKHISIQIASDIMIGATQSLKFQVIDLSEKGISLVVSENNIKYFSDGLYFSLTALMNKELDENIEMKLIYFHQFKFKQNGKITRAYRVGLYIPQGLNVEQLAIMI